MSRRWLILIKKGKMWECGHGGHEKVFEKDCCGAKGIRGEPVLEMKKGNMI